MVSCLPLSLGPWEEGGQAMGSFSMLWNQVGELGVIAVHMQVSYMRLREAKQLA